MFGTEAWQWALETPEGGSRTGRQAGPSWGNAQTARKEPRMEKETQRISRFANQDQGCAGFPPPSPPPASPQMQPTQSDNRRCPLLQLLRSEVTAVSNLGDRGICQGSSERTLPLDGCNTEMTAKCASGPCSVRRNLA